MLFICHLKALSGRFSEPSDVLPNKKKQGITFGLRLLLSALNPSKVLLSFNSDSYANETTIQPLKEKSTAWISKSAHLKVLREVVGTPSVIPSQYYSCLSFICKFCVATTCKKAECNIKLLFIWLYPVTLRWCFDNQWNYTKFFIVSVRNARIPLSCNLLHYSTLNFLGLIHAELDFSSKWVKEMLVELCVGAQLVNFEFPHHPDERSVHIVYAEARCMTKQSEPLNKGLYSSAGFICVT